MNLFEQAGEFKPDSLIAGNSFPILKRGIGLKAGKGVLKRGSLIMKGADGAGYIAGAEEGEGKVFGLLTDDCDTGEDVSADNIPAVCYQTGGFNREAVAVSGGDRTVEDYEDDMRCAGIYLRSVQNYK